MHQGAIKVVASRCQTLVRGRERRKSDLKAVGGRVRVRVRVVDSITINSA